MPKKLNLLPPLFRSSQSVDKKAPQTWEWTKEVVVQNRKFNSPSMGPNINQFGNWLNSYLISVSNIYVCCLRHHLSSWWGAKWARNLHNESKICKWKQSIRLKMCNYLQQLCTRLWGHSAWPGAVPVQAATMGCCGKQEVWSAQGKALRDPWPDVPHLLHADNLRGEAVRVEGQLHVLSESKEMVAIKDHHKAHTAVTVYKGNKKNVKRKWRVKTTHLELWNNQCSKHHDEMKKGQTVDGIKQETHQTKGNNTVMSIVKCHNKK